MKKIAIIGKPNVGKSSLFNRLIKKRDAVTSDISGTTRDVKKHTVEILDKKAILLDTGGLDDSSELFSIVKAKSISTAKKADIIIYMVDGRTIPDDDDKKLFYELETLNKDIALVVNKLDNDNLEASNLYNYYEFGTDPILPVSISHNRKVNRLLEWIESKLDDNEPIKETKDSIDEFLDNENNIKDTQVLDKNSSNDDDIKIAIIGKVNVGKSSLLNAILNDDRSIVSSIAGTTVDPVDEIIKIKDRNLRIIDTAGIRRRGQIKDIEKYALSRTKELLSKADVALIVIDASKEYTELDEKIAGLVDEYNLASIIVLNKWDIALKDFSQSLKELRYKFKFLYYSPVITLSAKTKQRVHKIHDMIFEVYDNYTKRITTSKLNDLIKESTMKHPLPSPNGKTLKIYYASQYNIKPPSISLIMNRANKLHFTYKRYLINQIRDKYGFNGSPIFIKAINRTKDDTNI